MRTSCKGKWLLLQPRSGASVHQDTHFYAQRGICRLSGVWAAGQAGEKAFPARLYRGTPRKIVSRADEYTAHGQGEASLCVCLGFNKNVIFM